MEDTEARTRLLGLYCVFGACDAFGIRSAIFDRIDELEYVPYEMEWSQLGRKAVY